MFIMLYYVYIYTVKALYKKPIYKNICHTFSWNSTLSSLKNLFIRNYYIRKTSTLKPLFIRNLLITKHKK